jgi:hypothetical protein
MLAVLLMCAGLIGLMPAPHAAAAGDPTLSLTPSASAVRPGETFSVSVDLGLPAGSHAVSGVMFRVSFDENMLAVKSASPNGAFPSVIERVTTASGVGLSLSVGTGDGAAVLNSTNVATIQFESKAGVDAKTSLHLAQAIASSIAKTDSPTANIIGQKPGTTICIAADLDCSPPQLVLSKEKSKYNGWVVATMTGFTPNNQITVTWPGEVVLCSATADGSGNGSCGFRTLLYPLGNYTLTARDTAGLSATDTLREIPRIKLTQYSGASGSIVRVYFYGFAPGDRVEVWWYTDVTSHKTLKTITIASNGRGTTLITIPDATIGGHMIRGKVVGVNRSASDTFTVTGPRAAEEPTATPSPTPEATGTPEPTVEPSPTDTPTIEVTPEPSPTDTPPVEASPTDTPPAEPSPTDTPIPSDVPTPVTPDAPAAVLPGGSRA